MNKRGQGLTLNTIIIAILVVIVLVIIVAFFLGGMTGLTRSIRSVFFGTTAGTDMALAVQTCQTRCDQAKLLPVDLREKSAYCTAYFNIDEDNDGEAEFVMGDGKKKIHVSYYCEILDETTYDRSLGVPCIFECPQPASRL